MHRKTSNARGNERDRESEGNKLPVTSGPFCRIACTVNIQYQNWERERERDVNPRQKLKHEKCTSLNDNNKTMCIAYENEKSDDFARVSRYTPSATSIVAAVQCTVHMWEFKYQRWQISRLPLDYDAENNMLSSLLRQHKAFEWLSAQRWSEINQKNWINASNEGETLISTD